MNQFSRPKRILPGVPPDYFLELGVSSNLPGIPKFPRRNNATRTQLESIYGEVHVSTYGRQYAPSPQNRAAAASVPSPSTSTPYARVSSTYHGILQDADAELQRLYLDLQSTCEAQIETLEVPHRSKSATSTTSNSTLSRNSTTASSPTFPPSREPFNHQREPSTPAKQLAVASGSRPTSCIICVEDFGSAVSAPERISSACLHEPSVCLECLRTYIKSELDSKIWNQITCPECRILLIYEDIKCLADTETFSR